jgi:4-carboxymuconolactone decarboxylase
MTLAACVYLTTVHAGFPRAIEAAQTLLKFLKEREQQAGGVK